LEYKKNLIVIGIVVIIIILLIGGFIFLNKFHSSTQSPSNSQSDGENNIVGNTKTSIHKDFRAIILSDWQEIEGVPPSTFVYLPPKVNQEDVEAEVISVATTFLGDNKFTLDQLLEQGVEGSKKIIPDFELTETAIWKGSNLQGKKIKFIGTQERIRRKSIQVFGIKYNILYAITYSCPINNCNHEDVFDNLIESFEPVNPEKND